MKLAMQTSKDIKDIRVVILFIMTFIVMQPQIVNAESPQDEGAVCAKALSEDSELARIKRKVGLSGVAEQTFEMKTNKAYPTALEKKAITLWVGKVRSCYDIIEKSMNDGQSQPSMVPLIKAQYPKFEQRVMQLYDKKITYGAFARARDEDQAAFLKDVEDAKRVLEQQQEQSRRQEQEKSEQARIEAQKEQEKREQARMEAQQVQSRNEANERASRCQRASQNAASFCNQKNADVVVNVGPGAYSNSGSGGYSRNGADAVKSGSMDYDCTYWSIKVSQDCR